MTLYDSNIVSWCLRVRLGAWTLSAYKVICEPSGCAQVKSAHLISVIKGGGYMIALTSILDERPR